MISTTCVGLMGWKTRLCPLSLLRKDGVHPFDFDFQQSDGVFRDLALYSGLPHL